MEVIKPYSTYKDSGIAWLGEVPEHWEIKKARNIGEFNGSTVDKKIDESQQKVRLVNFLDVYNNPKFEIHEKPFMVVTAKDEQIKKFRVNIGDVVFTPSSEVREDIGRSAVIKYEANDLVHSYHVIRLKFKENLDINFKKYLFNNYFVLKYFSKVCTGSTRKILTRQNFNNIELAIPTLPEQTAIANFLDYKTAKIDRFIFKKKQLIKLLNEQKAAIINDAVTKGLNPNAKMKPSGIEWLGDIPGHWEVRKLKYLGKFQNGISAGAEYFGSGFPFINYGDVYKNFELPKIGSGLANSSEQDRQNYSVRQGDVFFTRTSETIEEIGYTSTCFSTIEDATFSGFLIRFRPYSDLLFEGFSKYYFRSNLHRRFFVKEMNLVIRASLSQELLKRMPVLLPTIDEQILIAKYIEKETAIINKTIATIEKEIALVQEYRTALIAEAVTGKIDVREYEVPSFEEDKEYAEMEEEMVLVAEEEINLD